VGYSWDLMNVAGFIVQSGSIAKEADRQVIQTNQVADGFYILVLKKTNKSLLLKKLLFNIKNERESCSALPYDYENNPNTILTYFDKFTICSV